MRRILLLGLTMIPMLSGPHLRAEPNTETYQDIIDKAQGLVLQKERGHALQLLLSSIQKESKRAPVPKELVQTLEDVASVFMSDKAQQAFELAISLRFSDPALSLQKQNEASRLEPDNLQITMEQFRLQLVHGNCADGAAVADRLFQQMPMLESVRLAAVQAALCRGKTRDAVKLRAPVVDVKKSPLSLHWQLADAEIQYNLGNKQKAAEILSNVEKANKTFPETSYWRWRLAKDTNKNADTWAEKYIAGCKSLSPRAARDYLNEPFLCRRVSEVESSLKKNNNAQP